MYLDRTASIFPLLGAMMVVMGQPSTNSFFLFFGIDGIQLTLQNWPGLIPTLTTSYSLWNESPLSTNRIL